MADAAEEALGFLRELEPPERGVTVEIEKATVIEPRPDGPKGVYRAPKGRAYYKGSQAKP